MVSPRNLWVGVLAAWMLILVSEGVRAQIVYPPHMPATPIPAIKGCTSQQEEFLRNSWRRAHYFVWRAEKLVRYVRSRPAGERPQLWSQDESDSSLSSAISRWFGPYDGDRAAFIAGALDKAKMRFEQRGKVVKGVKTLRCGSPIAPARDANIDICPNSNPGSNGPPSAYHAPVGTIVTCPVFWNDATNGFKPFEDRLNDSSRRLVHELFHWLSVNGKYVVDRHADGAGGEKDRKYYGIDDATYLAQHKRSWAARNNDNYAYFARAVGLAAPQFTALFIPKEASGRGGLFLTLSWDGLVAKWKELAGQQYLADVESYVLGGKRQFLALWRIGTGNGALYLHDWPHFSQTWGKLKSTQDLIDIETFATNQGRRYLGVWREKPPGREGDGGLLAGLSWSALTDRWKEIGSVAYLADVETYIQNSDRKYIGVWRVGQGNGALYQMNDWEKFATTKRDLNPSQEMLDFEMFQAANGRWHFLGVWRASATSGPLYRGFSLDALTKKWQELKGSHTLVDVETRVPLAAMVK